MSLIGFHRLLISIAILFCAGYAFWEISEYRETSNIRSLLIALAFLGATFALAYYLRHLGRILRLSDQKRPPR
jgi:hypothetical protein